VVVLELDEPAIPLPLVDEPVAPVPEVELDASAPGAGDGEVVVVVVVEGDDAGGGVVTVFSSFLLHAVKPIATKATMRSERFMFFSFRRTSHGVVSQKNERQQKQPFVSDLLDRHEHFTSSVLGLRSAQRRLNRR
jgi:hypothetical protein